MAPYQFSFGLTPSEFTVIRQLASGMTYLEAARESGKSPENIRVVISRLRAKTGIKDMKDASKCAKWLQEYGLGPSKVEKSTRKLTAAQAAVLQEIANGKLYHQAAHALGINHQTARNYACEGFKRIGANGLCGEQLRAYIRKALGMGNPPVTMDDPFFN